MNPLKRVKSIFVIVSVALFFVLVIPSITNVVVSTFEFFGIEVPMGMVSSILELVKQLLVYQFIVWALYIGGVFIVGCIAIWVLRRLINSTNISSSDKKAGLIFLLSFILTSFFGSLNNKKKFIKPKTNIPYKNYKLGLKQPSKYINYKQRTCSNWLWSGLIIGNFALIVGFTMMLMGSEDFILQNNLLSAGFMGLLSFIIGFALCIAIIVGTHR